MINSSHLLESGAAFISSMSYEVGIIDYAPFPSTDEPVWILGNKYSVHYDLKELQYYIKSRLWFTYRKNFSPIGGVGPTSDAGWGCMLRCGQMMLAQALICRHLQRTWKWQRGSYDPKYAEILRHFLDKKDSYYSIHQIASMGASEGKPVGTWFGPNTIAQVLKKLSVYDEWSGLEIHVAMDNTVIKNDILKLCRIEKAKKSCDRSKHKCSNKKDKIDTDESNTNQGDDCNNASNNTAWKPLLLIIPLRLGLTEINSVYIESLKSCLTFRQSVGIIGGKPNHAYWFIGHIENELIYLDPHTIHNCENNLQPDFSDDTYHCPHSCRMNIMDLDPSVALGFFCNSEGDFEDLCTDISKHVIRSQKTPMFELLNERSHSWENYDVEESLMAADTDFPILDRHFDTDEEFELL